MGSSVKSIGSDQAAYQAIQAGQADFAQLEQFVETVRFDHVGVFTYSHEEGTLAAGMEDSVPEGVKRERLEQLLFGELFEARDALIAQGLLPVTHCDATPPLEGQWGTVW